MNDTAVLGRVRELLDYNVDTGVFTRRVNCSNTKAGAIAGSVHKDGYLQIAIDGRRYLSHRLAWLYVHGRWPCFEIDHINGIRTDNRIVNLRDVPKAVNQQNLKAAPRGKASGAPLGVTWYRKSRKWRAQIAVDGKQMHIGYFDTVSDAHEAYLQRKRQVHEGNTL